MDKRGIKTTETLKIDVATTLKERGYDDKLITKWLEYVYYFWGVIKLNV